MEAHTQVFLVLAGTLALFIWGRWRYDIVALLALLAVATLGLIPPEELFLGFGHPAVVTVAAVLVVSRGLRNSGVVDLLARWLYRVGDRPEAQVGALSSLVAALSSFMNNVGAVALLMPVAIRMARKAGHSPSLLLMPLAFASLLGGLVTLIGTPPNIIIATFRREVSGEPFRMFDFLPVGLAVAVAGVAVVASFGWRLVPQRDSSASRDDMFEIGDYVTEVRVSDESVMVGRSVRQLATVTEAEVVILGIVREDKRQQAPSSFEKLQAGDLLVVEADPTDLRRLVHDAGFELSAQRKLGEEALGQEAHQSLIEAVVMADSPVVGQTARSLNLRWRYGVNLLGVARLGARLRGRLRDIRLRVGDVLLLHGPTDSYPEALTTLSCLPLAGRELAIGPKRRIGLGLGLFCGAIGIATLGLLPIQVTFTAAAVAMIIFGIIPLREAYQAIDWPVLFLLGGMIPLGEALEKSGGAQLLADGLLRACGDLAPVVSLSILMWATVMLSDVINNAAAAVLMAPIGIAVASGMGVSTDPYLMAVAIGASCAFLTPIGHQSNTLVMGPGGYQFGDYWKLGLVLEVVIMLVAIPMILLVWPFSP